MQHASAVKNYGQQKRVSISNPRHGNKLAPDAQNENCFLETPVLEGTTQFFDG
jgi:hypothetical protein